MIGNVLDARGRGSSRLAHEAKTSGRVDLPAETRSPAGWGWWKAGCQRKGADLIRRFCAFSDGNIAPGPYVCLWAISVRRKGWK